MRRAIASSDPKREITAGEINRGVAGTRHEEAVCSAGVLEYAHNVTARVHIPRSGGRTTRD